MRRLMGVINDRHVTYYAQQRVPPRLQEAVARVLNSGKAKQVFLKRSLGTKNLKAANVAAKPVLADFDRTLADAEALLKERPVLSSITDAQIRYSLSPSSISNCCWTTARMSSNVIGLPCRWIIVNNALCNLPGPRDMTALKLSVHSVHLTSWQRTSELHLAQNNKKPASDQPGGLAIQRTRETRGRFSIGG
jgi:hypothetical protein